MKKTDIEESLKELYPHIDFSLNYKELKSRVLRGFAYTIYPDKDYKPREGERKVILQTGQGGVLLYIKACKEKGIPAGLIANNIIVHTDMGAGKLADVKIIKRNEK